MNRKALLLAFTTVIISSCNGCDGDQLASTGAEESLRNDGALSDSVAEKIEFLIAHLHDDPDPQHAEYSTAVYDLIEIGEPAIPRMLDLMESSDFLTRLRAETVIRSFSEEFIAGPNGDMQWTNEMGNRWLALWEKLGALDAQASAETRRESVAKWRNFLSERKGSRVP